MKYTIAMAHAQKGITKDIDVIRSMVLSQRVVGLVCDTDDFATSFEVVKLSDGTYLVQCTIDEYLYWCADQETAIQIWLSSVSDTNRFWKDVRKFFGKADSSKFVSLHE